MFERFGDQARQVIVLAQEEARTLRQAYIGTEHILLGLLREERGPAAQVLERLGVGLVSTRQKVVRTVGLGEKITSGQTPFTPRAKKILELALREALSREHEYIGTEHLLLGLVAQREGVAAEILAEFGLEPEAVRAAVDEMAPSSPAGVPWSRKEAARRRLATVEAYLAVIAVKEEAVRVIGEAEDRNDAVSGLRRLLPALSEDQAAEILDLRLTRLTRAEVAKLTTERGEIKRHLEE